MLRGAIIGLGNVAVEAHLPAWAQRRDVEIVAISDVDAARRHAVGARLPAARWYDSSEALIAREPLDFVDICTSPASHRVLICGALERGLHVLCEKPLVLSPDDLTSVTRLAARTRRVVHTVHNWHHAPIIKQATDLLRQGAIGHLTRVGWRTLRTKPAGARPGHETNWRLDPAVAGGGILTDHGWHVFYLICRWIGASPTSVSARLDTRRHTAWPVEDTATVRVAFPRATAEIFLTWAADGRENGAELVGTDGTIELHDDTLVVTEGGRERRWVCSPPLSTGSAHPDWFEPVANQFVGEMTGSVRPDSNLGEAWLCTTLESLARESNRRGGQAVAVPTPPMPA